MRRAAKSDRNQAEIVDALRKAGVSVQSLHRVGGGVPDLMCARERRDAVLMEVKRPGGKLNELQKKWRYLWRGHIHVVTTPLEALHAMGLA